MKDEAARPDYRRVKVAALQELARGGDGAAVRELDRRGLDLAAVVDVTRLDYLALRRLVLAWHVERGDTRNELARRRALAERAQSELEVRFIVDQKLYKGSGSPPVAPLAPPWSAPRAPRCISWQRPRGSTLYPSEEDVQRARLNVLAREVYARKAAGVPQLEE